MVIGGGSLVLDAGQPGTNRFPKLSVLRDALSFTKRARRGGLSALPPSSTEPRSRGAVGEPIMSLPDLIGMWIIAAVIWTLGALCGQYLGPYVSRYRLTSRRVEVTLFGLIPGWGIRFADIEDVWVCEWSWRELTAPRRVSWANRLWWAKGIVVRRSRGFFRDFIFTPDDPEQFLRDIRRRVIEFRRGEQGARPGE
jgi:hypothetical protein